jgi:outer membrane protein assembly factor BamB
MNANPGPSPNASSGPWPGHAAPPGLAPLRPDDPKRLGDYRVVGRLGEGGQGSVFLAHGSAGEPVAIKVLHARFGADPKARARFIREVDAARRVAGFCTARVLGADLDGAVPYVVSEFIEGPSLRDYLTRHGPQSGGALERLAIGTLTALAAIHRAGIVHRDFKPANVLLSAEGPRVVDFGIARALDATSTLTSQAIGTPAYMAPEQLAGHAVTTAADLFSWAATMAHVATGRPPFGADSVAAVVAAVLDDEPDLGGLDGRLRPMVAGCLAKDPATRPTAPELLARLLAGPATPGQAADGTRRDAAKVLTELYPTLVQPTFLDPGTIPPPPAPPTGTADRSGPVSRRGLLIGAGAALALAGGTVAVSLLSREDERTRWRHEVQEAGGLVDRMFASGDAVFFAADGGPVYALDAATGRPRWTRDGEYQHLAFSGQALFAAAGDRVDRIDAATGRIRWSVPDAPTDIAVAGDLVITARALPKIIPKLGPNLDNAGIRALDAATGKQRWSRSIATSQDLVKGITGPGPGPAPALSASTQVVVYLYGLEVYGLAPATGKIRWHFRRGGGTQIPAAVTGDTVLVGGRGNPPTTIPPFSALDAATGKPRWQLGIAQNAETPPAVDAQSVYVGYEANARSGINESGIYALDLRTGGKRWRADFVQAEPWGPFGGLLYATSGSRIYALDAATGKTRWQEDKDTFTVAANDTTVFVEARTTDGGLEQSIYALRAGS